MLHPLITISSPITYQHRESGQIITFFPGNRFTWRGVNMDIIGAYQFLTNNGRDYLELTYNYAREETYRFVVLQMEQGVITGFSITDRQGRETQFWKV